MKPKHGGSGSRIYQITGTNHYGTTREELKPERKKLNAEAGVSEDDKTIPNGRWPYQIGKGPDHANFE